MRIVLTLVVALLAQAGCDVMPSTAAPQVRARPAYSPTSVSVTESVSAAKLRVLSPNSPVVDVNVNGARMSFLFDTGAMMHIVFADSARKQKSPIERSTVAVVDGAESMRRSDGILHVDRLDLGLMQFYDFDAMVVDKQRVTTLGKQLDGVLGLPIANGLLVTLDIARGSVEFSRGSLPPADDQEVFDIQLAQSGHVLVPATIGEKRVSLMIDSGFSGGLIIPELWASAFDGAERSVPLGAVHTLNVTMLSHWAVLSKPLKIGKHEVIAPQVILVERGTEATIGMDLLAQFRVTFDLSNRRVRLKAQRPGPLVLPPPVLDGVEIDASMVVRRLSDGPAFQAGVKVGDKLTSINGIPAARVMSGADLDKFRNIRTIDFQFDRAGAQPIRFKMRGLGR